MTKDPVTIIMLIICACHCQAQQLVVADMESKVPIRDILIYTDDNQETKSNWDGTFSLKKGYKKISFSNPNYEGRYVTKEELKGDTIYLIPKMNALREVVIYGQRKSLTEKTGVMLSKVDAQLIGAGNGGANLLGLLALAYDEIWGKKIRHREELKKQKYKMIMDNY